MRPSQKGRGPRNKNGRNKPVGNVINRVFESAGPEGKVRGTPQQIIEKYQLLARDAQTSGERVLSESYLQHAEHYTRLLNAALEQAEERRQQQLSQQPEQQTSQGDDRGGSHRPSRTDSDPRFEPAGGSSLATIESDSDDGPVQTPENSAPATPLESASASVENDAAPRKTEPRRRRRKAPAAEDVAGEDVTGEGGAGETASGEPVGTEAAPAEAAPVKTAPSRARRAKAVPANDQTVEAPEAGGA